MLGAPPRPQHVARLLSGPSVFRRGGDGGITSAGAGLPQRVRQPYYLLFHEPPLPTGFSDGLQMWSLQVSFLTEKNKMNLCSVTTLCSSLLFHLGYPPPKKKMPPPTSHECRARYTVNSIPDNSLIVPFSSCSLLFLFLFFR